MARGIPRLASHGWALALAVIVLALGPLGFRHPIADVQATSGSVTVPLRTSVDDVALGTGSRSDVETKLHRPRFSMALKADDLAAPAAPADAGATREHLVRFAWPTHGTITQTFFAWHPGIDIANDVGTPEVAADGGHIVFAGWDRMESMSRSTMETASTRSTGTCRRWSSKPARRLRRAS